jgi:hypothetical protein
MAWFVAAACLAAFLAVAVLAQPSEREAQANRLEQVRLEHAALCAKLGHAPGTTDHQPCMDELGRLKQHHEQLFLEQTAGLL